MTTIMVVGTGDSAQRCDATCHDATGPSCSCICGGRYHGAGRGAQAMLTQDVVAGKLSPELAEAAKLAAMSPRRRARFLRRKAYRERTAGAAR